MIDLDDENFEREVLNKKGIFLVDFWSHLCPPCYKLSLILDNVAKELGEKIGFGKLNIFEGPETAKKYKIPATPTIIIFKDGEPIEKAVGIRSEQVLIDKLNSLI
jgi:thioredoxin 1